MIVTRLRLKNWRNFKTFDIDIADRAYIIGPNAVGKSNLLDVFRFIRDVAKTDGGGLQKAVSSRGGIPRIRCLHARQDNEIKIELWLKEDGNSESTEWKYELAIRNEVRGSRRSLVSSETVVRDGNVLLSRPSKEDELDVTLLTQTSLEQIQANTNFRSLAEFFSEISFVHLVPQLLKYSDVIGGNRLEDDPFGQGFLERIARANESTRNARLKRIERALTVAVPRFTDLRFVKDAVNGRPHLEARYEHYRPNAGWQREDSFSDGTLRLIALLWILQEGDSLLLLEEPELSLNDAIVREIPLLIQQVQAKRKKRRQVILTTHSEALLSNAGIDAKQMIVLEPGKEGSSARLPDQDENNLLSSGFSPAEILLPKTRPEAIGVVPLWS